MWFTRRRLRLPQGTICFPVSTINLLENTAQSWYDAGYVNVRRRYSHGLTFLANYTWSKNLSDAPDFRSPMYESAIPQNNNDLASREGTGLRRPPSFRAERGLRHSRPASNHGWLRTVTKNWQLSTVYQVQTGLPFTISVFGDTANSGTVLGENPIRANVTGQPYFRSGTHTATQWFNPGRISRRRPPSPSAMWAATRSTGQECRRSTSRWRATSR